MVEPFGTNRAKALGWAGALVAMGVVTSARLDLVASLADQGRFDKYLHFAGRIVARDLPVERLGDLSPGYLWSVAALLAAGIGPIGIRTLQVIAVSVAAALCGVAAKRCWGSPAAVVAAAVVLGSRGALVNATDLEPETLILLLHAVAVWLLVATDGPTGRLGAGLVLGLSAATRPTALVPALAIAAWLAWAATRATAHTRRSAVLAAVLYLAGLAIPVVAVRVAYAAIPGSATPMNPGTVLYEGLNPSATGYSGEAPQIVTEVELGLAEPDALHIAYRVVAARAHGGSANRFWLDRAVAFVSYEPAAAARLLVTKLRLTCASYEAWDLKSMAMKDLELQSRPWIPFGPSLAMAVAGFLVARARSAVIPAALLAAGPALTMVAFYVTSRQRNALIPPLALLAAAGVTALVELWRSGKRRTTITLLVLIVASTTVLTIDGPIQREDRWRWIVRAARDDALANADSALAGGDAEAARSWRAEAALHGAPIADAAVARLVCDAVRTRLARVTVAAERFDLAMAARRCGDLETADRTLQLLSEVGYTPLRGAQLPPSVAYQRAVIALRRGDVNGARSLAAAAEREAPGTAEVLALTIALHPPGAAATEATERELYALHDPFTAGFALARVQAWSGRPDLARQLAIGVAEAIPEWSRPREWLDRRRPGTPSRKSGE